MAAECLNCGEDTEDTHDLLVRSNRHGDVPLCDDCFAAISDQIGA